MYTIVQILRFWIIWQEKDDKGIGDSRNSELGIPILKSI